MVFICGCIVGYFSRSFQLSYSQKKQTESIEETTTPFLKRTFKSPSKKKTIILEDDRQGGTSVILSQEGKEEEIGGGLLIGGVNWSPSESKIAYSSGTPSAGYSVEIIDLNSKKAVSVDDQTYFMDLPENKKYSFGHIYSNDLTWLDDNHLVVQVTRRPDTLEHTVTPKFFLINGETGKVIKEIL